MFPLLKFQLRVYTDGLLTSGVNVMRRSIRGNHANQIYENQMQMFQLAVLTVARLAWPLIAFFLIKRCKLCFT